MVRSFSEDELMIMQEPGDSFLLLWAGTVCNATSRFLHKWYEEDAEIEKKKTKTVRVQERKTETRV